jgi:hypothetical protein
LKGNAVAVAVTVESSMLLLELRGGCDACAAEKLLLLLGVVVQVEFERKGLKNQ